MAQKPVDGSQLDNTTVDAATLGGLSVGAGANNIVQRDGSGNIDADTLGGLSVGTGANDIVQLNGSSQLPAVDGSLLTGLPGGNITKYKTSTTAKSSDTTLANDPHLFGFVLEASSFYIIEGAFFYTANSITPDLKLGWVKSVVTVTDSFSLMAAQSNSLGGIQEISSGLTGIKTIDITQTGARHALLSGYVSTSGIVTLDFQWAQNVSDAANVSMINGSWVRFTKVS